MGRPVERRAAVLGYGLVSAIGWSAAETWRNLLGGEVGLGRLPSHISSLVRSRAAYLLGLSYTDDRLIRAATMAADEATAMAGTRTLDAIVVGSSSAGFAAVEKAVLTDDRVDPSRLRPGALAEGMAAAYSVRPDRTYQCSEACASSASAIAVGVDLIGQGSADFVLAGGADEVTAAAVAGFESCRIHAETCRPFDEARRGLVLGEAAAFVVLGNASRARRAGIQVIGYVEGSGLSCDAYHMSSPDPCGAGIARAIRMAVGCQRESPIDFVCAHGTGTRHNDAAEAAALALVFNAGVPPVASYKGSLGHPQGASGACGIVLTLKAMQHDLMFPNVGLQAKDPTIHLDIVSQARSQEIRRALCLSSGSWGANAAIVLSKA